MASERFLRSEGWKDMMEDGVACWRIGAVSNQIFKSGKPVVLALPGSEFGTRIVLPWFNCQKIDKKPIRLAPCLML
jgi:hypothetical protein